MNKARISDLTSIQLCTDDSSPYNKDRDAKSSKITGDGNCSHEIKRHLLPGRKAMTNLELYRKAETSLCQKDYGFSSSHVQVWQLDRKEGWALKNWYFQIVVLEKIL